MTPQDLLRAYAMQLKHANCPGASSQHTAAADDVDAMAARIAAMEARVSRLQAALEHGCSRSTLFQICEEVLDTRAAIAPAPTPDANTVPMPQNADQAVLMWLIGERWVRENAPERLRSDAPPPAPEGE